MDEKRVQELLAAVRAHTCTVEDALGQLKGLATERLNGACLDHHRALRTGIPEVVYGESKSAAQIAAILQSLRQRGGQLMATRVSREKAAEVQEALPFLHYHEDARMLTGEVPDLDPAHARGTILVISAGTSDIPVAEEAAVTARCLRHPVERLYDCGVAGLHRLLEKRDLLAAGSVLIVVAGMEGALPSVVGGLVDKPVIAVPTSVGYGVGFGGVAALLGMLNTCAPGVAVVNIDNGFGAGCMAAIINRRAGGLFAGGLKKNKKPS